MVFSRRMIVAGLAGAAATAGGVSQSLFMSAADITAKLRPVGRGRRNAPLATATYDDWALHKGSFFTLDTGDIVKLVDVQAFPMDENRPANVRAQAFVNRFEIERGQMPKEERVYRLAHRNGGEFELFLKLGTADSERLIAVIG